MKRIIAQIIFGIFPGLRRGFLGRILNSAMYNRNLTSTLQREAERHLNRKIQEEVRKGINKIGNSDKKQK